LEALVKDLMSDVLFTEMEKICTAQTHSSAAQAPLAKVTDMKR
jgi:hypothetical protein